MIIIIYDNDDNNYQNQYHYNYGKYNTFYNIIWHDTQYRQHSITKYHAIIVYYTVIYSRTVLESVRWHPLRCSSHLPRSTLNLLVKVTSTAPVIVLSQYTRVYKSPREWIVEHRRRYCSVDVNHWIDWWCQLCRYRSIDRWDSAANRWRQR